ncbi:hypothetical protein CYMTET_50223 [Cymbomonas tetramitiformis]|uniref:50S ribosomal protein L22, chloroplastic n=1 Tax=Cymbomonas tetramitiformis TaxID=36881 RepID=A0AAE0BNH4_9CHLO|nr:hypothetical protein CYMTET_50223 [Cymbomonas tetramitiformis]
MALRTLCSRYAPSSFVKSALESKPVGNNFLVESLQQYLLRSITSTLLLPRLTPAVTASFPQAPTVTNTTISNPTLTGKSTEYDLRASTLVSLRQISTHRGPLRQGDSDPLTPEASPFTIVPRAATATVDDEFVTGKASAFWRNASISPRKLKLACTLLRGLTVRDALIQCDLSPKKSLALCKKLIKDCVANAVNTHGLDKDKLIVGKILANKGVYMKRVDFRGRGRTTMLKKYRSHLEVEVHEVRDFSKVQRRVYLRKDYGPRPHFDPKPPPPKLFV